MPEQSKTSSPNTYWDHQDPDSNVSSISTCLCDLEFKPNLRLFFILRLEFFVTKPTTNYDDAQFDPAFIIANYYRKTSNRYSEA